MSKKQHIWVLEASNHSYPELHMYNIYKTRKEARAAKKLIKHIGFKGPFKIVFGNMIFNLGE